MDPKGHQNGTQKDQKWTKTDLKWSIVKIRSFEPKRHLTNFLLILYFYGFSAMKPPSFLWFDHQRDGFQGLKGILCILWQSYSSATSTVCSVESRFPPLFIHPFQPLFISFMVSIFKGFLDVTQLCFLEMVLLLKPAGRCLPGRPSAERLLRSQYIYMAIHLSSIAWGAHKNKGRKKKGNNQERREA